MRSLTKRQEWTARVILIVSLFTLIKELIPVKRDQTKVEFLYGKRATPQTETSQPKQPQVFHQLEAERLDPRAATLMVFFEQRNSPLTHEAVTFVEVADKYNLDWKLLPAISCKESGCGEFIPWNHYENRPSYNPFGWGVHGESAIYFENWQQAIEGVGKNIKANYYDKGLTTPEQIEETYTPLSLDKGRSWSRGVSYLMEEMKSH